MKKILRAMKTSWQKIEEVLNVIMCCLPICDVIICIF
jgi:hypothetical protein